jgi:hypothetical protein
MRGETLRLAVLLAAATAAGCGGTARQQEALFGCRYEDPYSHAQECQAYLGDWTATDAQARCDATFTTAGFVGTLTTDPCDPSTAVGSCQVEVSGSSTVIYYFYDLAGDQLEMARKMCEKVLKGTWSDGGGNPDAGTDEECAALLAEAWAGMISDDDVVVTPECQDDACLAQLINDKQWITFEARNTTPAAGLIFYPGGGVDPRVYAPILKDLAKWGYLVALVPMPGNVALAGYGRADGVIAGIPTITDWFLAGHSLGGVGVEAYVKEHPTTARGFIHWASYGATEFDIHEVELPGVSIYGTADGKATPQEVQDGAAFLPQGTGFVRLDGANHVQFGHLCDMADDLSPDISRDRQQELVVAATRQFVERVLGGDWSVHDGFVPATDEATAWCQEAQRLLVNPGAGELPAEEIVNVINVDSTTFAQSNAAIEGGTVSVESLIRQGANPWSLEGPAVIEGEVWCKMKSQAGVAQALGLTPAGAEGSCATVNEAVVAWALAQVSAEERAAYEASGKRISFLPDASFASGPDWLDAEIGFAESSTAPGTYELTAASLAVGDDATAPAEKRQVHYCKLWAPARALLWVLARE